VVILGSMAKVATDVSPATIAVQNRVAPMVLRCTPDTTVPARPLSSAAQPGQAAAISWSTRFPIDTTADPTAEKKASL
jgi:hypothetical protein